MPSLQSKVCKMKHLLCAYGQSCHVCCDKGYRGLLYIIQSPFSCLLTGYIEVLMAYSTLHYHQISVRWNYFYAMFLVFSWINKIKKIFFKTQKLPLTILKTSYFWTIKFSIHVHECFFRKSFPTVTQTFNLFLVT